MSITSATVAPAPSTALPQTFEEAIASLASRIDGFEVRPQQADLSRSIEAEFFSGVLAEQDREMAIRKGEWHPRGMFAQGPTGVGKSLAYMIPAIISGKRVVVSVTTKALQSQLEQTDLPFLEKYLRPFTWAILKGRSSYLCLNRDVPDGEVPALSRISEWVRTHPDFSGLREDLPVEVSHREWAMICSDSEECSAMECSRAENREGCYAARARAAARAAQVVVVNHALFFTDLAVRVATEGNANLLGEFDALIADEAHELHEVASGTLASEFSPGSFQALANNVRGWVHRNGSGDSGQKVDEAVMALSRATTDFFRAMPDLGRNQTLRIRVNHLEDLADSGVALLDGLGGMWESLTGVTSISDDKQAARKSALLARVRNLTAMIESFLTDDLSEVVRWIEKVPGQGNRPPSVKAKTAPIDISGYLNEHLFSQWPVLMISATLAVKGRFDFQAKQLGVTDYAAKIVDSPFDYTGNSRLYVPANFPATNSQAWESTVANEIRTLVSAAGGRTLVLFTSTAHMRRAYDILRDVLPYPVRMQGEDSVPNLRAWFAASDETVLLGTKSFMTGFDVRGSALTNVIITKMPFPVPDEPLTEARCEVIEARGGSAFSDYSMPVMSLVLQQAAGRLIRHSTDRGVVAILDSRLVTKGYGKQIVRDMPPMTLVKSQAEAVAFLEQTAAYFEGQR